MKPRRALAFGLALCILSSCNPFSPEDKGVSADDVFWRAYMGPETFDSWLATQALARNASSCLSTRSDTSFSAEQNRRRECGQMVSGTTSWNLCHDEADNFHNAGVIANDIVRAINREKRFDVSQGGQYLITAKSLVGSQDWNTFVDFSRQNLPQVKCS